MKYAFLYDNHHDCEHRDGATVIGTDNEAVFNQTLRRREIAVVGSANDPIFRYVGMRALQMAEHETEYRLLEIVRDNENTDHAVYVRAEPILIRYMSSGTSPEVGLQVVQSAHPEYALPAYRYPHNPIMGRISRVEHMVSCGERYGVSRVHLTIDPTSLRDERLDRNLWGLER